MFIVGMLSWWYGAGWIDRMRIVRERLMQTIDYFSIGLLLQTLFEPYRQISAGKIDGPIGLQWRAFVDRTISRLIGAMVRLIIVTVGVVAILFHSLLGLLTIVLWLFIPLLPIFGFILFISGWVPLRWN